MSHASLLLGLAMSMTDAEDAADFRAGASWIPGEVTLARRRHEPVAFNPADGWTLRSGAHIDLQGNRSQRPPEPADTRTLHDHFNELCPKP